MTVNFRIKRRANGGGAGAPASLQNAELAYNEQTNILYYGTGTGGAGGTATSIIAIAGSGAFVSSQAAQAQNSVLAGPSAGGAGAPSFRSLIAADIPTLTAIKISDFDTQVRTSRLDQMVAPIAAVSLNSQRIINLAEPVSAQDAATKNYVDNAVQGLNAKASVKCASTADQALSGGVAFPTIDGIAVAAGIRVLLKDQTTTSQNGIYIVGGIATAWTLTRALDADTWTELVNAYTWVEQGTANSDTAWVCPVDQGGVLGTTAVTFVQFTGAAGITAGAGLTKTGNTIDVVGTANRISVAADSIDIAATYAGQASITTLGTVATGTWQATTISVAYGGTGAASLTGYVKGNGVAAMTASPTIPNTDITGLGTMSTQNAAAVAITGGTIDGVTLDGGTF